jgi:hypothetical protein
MVARAVPMPQSSPGQSDTQRPPPRAGPRGRASLCARDAHGRPRTAPVEDVVPGQQGQGGQLDQRLAFRVGVHRGHAGDHRVEGDQQVEALLLADLAQIRRSGRMRSASLIRRRWRISPSPSGWAAWSACCCGPRPSNSPSEDRYGCGPVLPLEIPPTRSPRPGRAKSCCGPSMPPTAPPRPASSGGLTRPRDYEDVPHAWWRRAT